MKLQRHEMYNSFELQDKQSITHYSVVGDPADFYIYLKEPPERTQPWSNRINDVNLYHKLKKAHSGSQGGFIALCNELFEKHKKMY